MELRIRQEKEAQVDPLILHRDQLQATQDRLSIWQKIAIWFSSSPSISK